MLELTIIQKIAMWFLPLVFAVTVHEVAHGYMAYLLSDKTAKILGRLTLNPIRHIDLLGSIVVPLVTLWMGNIVIGWAKPVPITTQNLKNPRRDFALISAAGPLSNFIMAVIWALIAKFGKFLLGMSLPGAFAIYMIGIAGISINFTLGLLNLIPIPPLDGSHIISSILPKSLARYYDRIAPFGFYILIGLIFSGVLRIILWPAVDYLIYLTVYHFNL